MNRVILIGRLGRNPELRSTTTGRPVVNFSLATDTPTDKPDWHQIVVWDKQAEACVKFLSKGHLVGIEGRLNTREWTDDQGVKRWTTEVVAFRVQFLARPNTTRPPAPPPEEFATETPFNPYL
jgi:single-strand DNA-binding protein